MENIKRDGLALASDPFIAGVDILIDKTIANVFRTPSRDLARFVAPDNFRAQLWNGGELK